MKTILYNPIFINPQAYYVFPRLTRWLRPDDGYKEPANYIGQIEVTIIAYGEIGYTEYFEHTNYIDFTNFSNSYVRISLFTRLGSCVLGEWKIGTMEGDRPYIEPEVLASLKAVVIVGDKTNQDKDRDTVANLVDASNPFIISNAAYKLNSGYRKYEVDFTTWSKRNVVTSNNDNSFSFESKVSSSLLYYSTTIGVDTPSFKIKANISNCLVYYYYINDKGTLSSISILESGEFELPISHNTLYNGNIGIGFEIGRINGTGTGTITQIPSYQGAFVTDGVDDLITSTKTVQEMLGGSNEITIVSMVHQVKDTTNNVSFTNYIRGSINGYFRNIVNNYGKTGIYGYTSSDLRSLSVINNILGDKNDYTSNGDNRDTIINGNFSVQGYSYNNSNNTGDFSSVAWYWTVIANKVLTTDQINQVIAYYNLDRCVEPTVLYDVKRQGLSNDTPDSDWYLKDFSKNGFDMSLFNFAKKLDSGIGKYGMDFLEWKSNSGMNFTSTKLTSTKPNLSGGWLTFRNVSGLIPETKVKVSGAPREFVFIANNNGTDDKFSVTINNGVYTIPEFTLSSASGFYINNNSGDWSNLVIEQIPSHAGALCFDGVEDYGKAIGLPVYKDYTFVIDYQRLDKNLNNLGSSSVLSKSPTGGQGAFLSNHWNNLGTINHCYSFGEDNIVAVDDSERKIYYQSKYSNQGISINAGSGTDGSNMWLGIIRDNDTRLFNGAIYSLMTFPYSMSEFLIERQLKKHKLGTLYPDMVEFRPIVKSNVKWNIIEIWQGDKSLYRPAVNDDKTGIYLKKDSIIGIYVKPKDADEVTKIVVNGTEYTNLKINSNGFYYVTLPITTSPQKIDITIDEYIRYEDIVQPYPEIWNITQNAKKVSWGDKLKVGSEFGYNSKVNLLSGLYSTANSYYNGKVVKTGDVLKVEKQMVFACDYSWIGGSNEPKCILSPSRLRIPNSSYKILGYIPDISGHGNHGKINNSAYAGMSGANGYTEKTFSEWSTSNKNAELSLANDVKLRITKVTKANLSVIYNQISYYSTDTIQRYKVTGVNESHPIIFGNDMPVNSLLTVTQDGEYEVDWKTYGKNPCIFTNWTGDCNITIEQVGEYEGAYCLDGVDDFIAIPTTVGGKQMLMKVNWQSSIAHGMLYDQRGYANEFAIWNSNSLNDNEDDVLPAYSARNNGQTYIDGILNNNIKASELRAITHNITITNELSSGVNNTYPVIGANKTVNAYFANMSLYDFMLFDEISTDEEILTLNEYVGIEGNTDDLFN